MKITQFGIDSVDFDWLSEFRCACALGRALRATKKKNNTKTSFVRVENQNIKTIKMLDLINIFNIGYAHFFIENIDKCRIVTPTKYGLIIN